MPILVYRLLLPPAAISLRRLLYGFGSALSFVVSSPPVASIPLSNLVSTFLFFPLPLRRGNSDVSLVAENRRKAEVVDRRKAVRKKKARYEWSSV